MKNQNSDATISTIISRHKKADAEMWLFTIFSSLISRALLSGLKWQDIVAVFNKSCELADDFQASYKSKYEKK